MKIRLLGYSITHIRSFHNIDIDFNKNGITLIMMPNGTGKTTSIELIKYALIGKMDHKQTVHTFKPHSWTPDSSSFKLRLELDEKKYTITMKFNFIDNTVEYLYTDTTKGVELRRPFELDVFSGEFVEKFIFDGELAKEFLNSDSAYAEESVKNIYHLEKLETLTSKVDLLKSLLIRESSETTASNEAGLTRHNNECDRLESIQKELINESKELKKQIESFESKISSIQSSIDSIYTNNRSIQDSIDKHNSKISQLKSELTGFLIQIAEGSLFVHNLSKPLWLENKNLIDVLVQMKLPKSVSEQFFIDIINHANTCICGRSLRDCEREYIKLNYEKYLEENNISILNEVKSYALNMSYSPDTELMIDTAKDKEEEIKREERKLQNAKRQINEQQKAKKDKLEKEKDELIRESQSYKSRYERITCDDDLIISKFKDEENLKRIRIKIEKLRKIIDEVERNRMINYNAEKLNAVINQTQRSLLDQIKSNVLEATNSKLYQIVRNDDVEVESIDRYIKIKNRDGVSVGQSLSVSYSFISALFEKSFYDLPFVIDSPAGSLDNSYRTEIAKIIPSIFNQLIIFVISSERPYFTDVISQFYPDDVKYYTIYKNEGSIMFDDSKELFETFQDKGEQYV